MIEFTICNNNDCPKRLSCLRYMKKPALTRTQNFSRFENTCKETTNYQMFKPMQDVELNPLRIKELKQTKDKDGLHN